MDTTIKILARYDLDRYEIIQIAKACAEPYLEKGQVNKAWISFCTVMRHHNPTKKDFNLSIGTMMVLRGDTDIETLKKFLDENFNE